MSAQHGQAYSAGRTNSLAIAALICGIVEFFLPPACLAAIILGHQARRQIRRTGEGGHGLATAGLVLGYFVLASTALTLGLALVVSSSAPGGPSPLH
jgi:hypothetical protein